MPEKVVQHFDREQYDVILKHLTAHRLDPYIQSMQKKKGPNKGLVFPFARGLRFSALLIYEIRKLIESESNLTASWGQIIDNDGNYFSRECDIIIHEKGYKKQWNGEGNGHHIMDFRFIFQSKVKAVISCKSYLTSSTIEVDYCKDVRKLVDKVWLFAECCGPQSVKPIKAKAVTAGYENFWSLYTWRKSSGEIEEQFNQWEDFLAKISQLIK